ncbi:microcephalin [Thalassophryne amazonica]|uniref:microcephalin n=1 Tax=Thalassophryne amazonica TaxID=390379 RepID=UPI0014713E9B|nr:microcephalin [Thalassophryne amazonica]
MTASNSCSSLLKDIIAYVDVWSSNKTANFSEPFIQQLQEMGAQVSKTFNKQVTHVVFNNGHIATWEKAKKRNVKLVSVLWVARCHEDGVHADEDLYPALNDNSDPVLKKKKHRCMQPRDSPEKTPENDRRLKKKLDKMMRDLGHKPFLDTDVSPIIIDEESGIVYSPAFKRSDYMAQRLKDMKEKHENLSPTASQAVESCSPSGPKPSLGSTPTTFKYDHLDSNSCASVAEHGFSFDKKRNRTVSDATDDVEGLQRKNCEKPWLSPCRDVPEWISVHPLDCPDFEDEEEWDKQKVQRRFSVRKKKTEKQSSVGLAISCQDGCDDSNSCHKEKTRSKIKDPSPAAKKSELLPDALNKGKTKAAKSFTENNAYIYPNSLNLSSCLSSPGNLDEATVEPTEGNASLLQKMHEKISKNGRSSKCALVPSLTLPSEPQNLASHSTDGNDNSYEDYFSPVNNHQRSLMPSLPVDRNILVPFVLDSVPRKRKQRCESIVSKTNIKKSKLEESQSGKNHTQLLCGSVNCEAQKHPHQNAEEPASPVESNCAIASPKASNKRTQNRTNAITTDELKQRRALTGEHLTVTETDETLDLWKNSDVSVRAHAVELRGSEGAAAGLTEVVTEDAQNSYKPVSFLHQNLDSKAKTMRTLVMTSMPTEKQHTVLQVVKALGGFSVVDQVCESTTHVVSGSQRRTLNILFGIARGCWILSYEWILWCLEKRQWVPEEPYELSDQFPAAQICRLQRHLSAGEHQQDLFQGQPAMFVSQHSQPPTQSLVELIQLCGGTVCKTVRQAGICIGKYSGRRPEGSRILSEQWVLDSITYLKQLSYDDYYLE